LASSRSIAAVSTAADTAGFCALARIEANKSKQVLEPTLKNMFSLSFEKRKSRGKASLWAQRSSNTIHDCPTTPIHVGYRNRESEIAIMKGTKQA